MGRSQRYNCVLLESFIHNYSGRERNNDFVAVFLKDKENENIYQNRIIDNFKDFRNGRTNRNERYQILDCLCKTRIITDGNYTSK